MVLIFSFLVLGASIERPVAPIAQDGNLQDLPNWIQDDIVSAPPEMESPSSDVIYGASCSVTVAGVSNVLEFPANRVIIDQAFQADPRFVFNAIGAKAKGTPVWLIDLSHPSFPYWSVSYENQRVTLPGWLHPVLTPGPFILAALINEPRGYCALIELGLPDNGEALAAPTRPVPTGKMGLNGPDDDEGGGGILIVSRENNLSESTEKNFARVESAAASAGPQAGMSGCGSIEGHQKPEAKIVWILAFLLLVIALAHRRKFYSSRTK